MTEAEYLLEERAAIMQFDARMTKEQAETAALVDTAKDKNKRAGDDCRTISGVLHEV